MITDPDFHSFDISHDTKDTLRSVFRVFKEHKTWIEQKKIFLAVSGGKDSMLLAEVCRMASLPFTVLHVNYMLRGEDSWKDEECVVNYCTLHGISYRVKRIFLSSEQGKSDRIQERARAKRYSWFKQVCSLNHGIICTGHHGMDQLETAVFHLSRGTGLRGAMGMQVATADWIFRPFLRLSSEEMNQLRSEISPLFREDKSNGSLKYTRNRLRNTIFPQLKEVFPQWEKRMFYSVSRLGEAQCALKQMAAYIRETQSVPWYGERLYKRSEQSLSWHESPIWDYLFEDLRISDVRVLRNWQTLGMGAMIQGKNGCVYVLKEGLFIVRSSLWKSMRWSQVAHIPELSDLENILDNRENNRNAPKELSKIWVCSFSEFALTFPAEYQKWNKKLKKNSISKPIRDRLVCLIYQKECIFIESIVINEDWKLRLGTEWKQKTSILCEKLRICAQDL